MPPTDADDFLDESDPLPPLDSMQYWRAYQFIFDNPNWFVNLLLMAVCNFIPIIGTIVISGYQFEMLEVMHRRGRDEYPEFDFGRFGDYLSRGIWPFLVAVVASLVIVPFMGAIVGFVLAFAGAFGGGPGAFGNWMGALSPAATVMLAAAGAALFWLVCIVFWMVMMSMMIRAGLMQEFGSAFDLKFARDFVSTMWVEIVLMILFQFVTMIPIAFTGFLACGIGIYVAAAALMMAQAHFQYQLYEIYLTRGGEPIPLKAED